MRKLRLEPSVLGLLALAIAIIVMTRTAWGYVPFVADDALISFRYGQRLLAGHGLTFNAGDAVEGYSNLLWVLLVAAGGLFTPDLILVGRVLGLICTALTLAAIVWACPMRSFATTLAACTGLAAIAQSHGMAIWAIGGLEQTLLCALLAWALALVAFPQNAVTGPETIAPDDIPIAAGGILALLVLTRPDGALFCALIALGLIAVHGLSNRALRGLLRLSWLPAVAWLGQEAFRLRYYRDWIPNTAYAKLAGSMHHVIAGLGYLGDAVLPHAPLLLIAVGGLILARPWRRRDVLIPVAVLIGWNAYVVFVGGDIFPGRRHVMPALVALTFLLVATARRVAGRLPILTAIACIAACVAYVPLQSRDIQNDRARTERWEWDCAALMPDLRTAFATQQPLLAADAIGCTGYFSQFPVLDMLGLTDRHLAHKRPADFGAGFVGHELGDGAYVLAREPDIVVFGQTGAEGPWFRSGLELVKLPEFARQYTHIVLKTFGVPVSHLWIRWTSPRIGVSRSANDVRIPGVLFATSATATARLLHGKIVAHVPAGSTVTFDRIPLDRAPWTGRVIGSGPATVIVEGSAVRVTAGVTDSDLAEVVLAR